MHSLTWYGDGFSSPSFEGAGVAVYPQWEGGLFAKRLRS